VRICCEASSFYKVAHIVYELQNLLVSQEIAKTKHQIDNNMLENLKETNIKQKE